MLVPAFGLDTIDHTLPSHTITNVSTAEPVDVEPTATHSDALTHDTEYSPSALVPAFGLDTIDQAVPSHTITNVSTAEPVNVEPTATHSDALTHDTEYSSSVMVPAFGLGTIVALSTTAPADVETTTPPNTIAKTANIARTDLRTIREPFD
jgi:hypothetical protein